MKYKVGDKVKIRSLKWYNALRDFDILASVKFDNGALFTGEMSSYCGKIATITELFKFHDIDIEGRCVETGKYFYKIDLDEGRHPYIDEMLEEQFNLI